MWQLLTIDSLLITISVGECQMLNGMQIQDHEREALIAHYEDPTTHAQNLHNPPGTVKFLT